MANELILIADDNDDIREFVGAALREDGYEVAEAKDGKTALEKFSVLNPHMMILDVSMGQPDGLEVCREVRKTSNVPIIMLTNRGEETDEAMCLAVGADDFITKPVTARILKLRVATQIRHASRSGEIAPKVLTAGSLALNLEGRELVVGKKIVTLTRTEFDFLRLLMEQPKRVFTKEQMVEAIGSSFEFSSDKLLDTHASRIRIKIRDAGGPSVPQAVRGVGYRLMAPESLNS
jgi:DNA-binding response OmpR family regulator